jgi:hypothetical protein
MRSGLSSNDWPRTAVSRAENAEDMMPVDENNFTFEIEDVLFQMIHGDLSTIGASLCTRINCR